MLHPCVYSRQAECTVVRPCIVQDRYLSDQRLAEPISKQLKKEIFLTETIQFFITWTELGVADIVNGICVSHMVHGDHKSWIIEIIPEASIHWLVPTIQWDCRVWCWRHEYRIQIVVAE